MNGVLQAFSGLEGYDWLSEMQKAFTLKDLFNQYGEAINSGDVDESVIAGLEEKVKGLYAEIFNIEDPDTIDLSQASASLQFQEYFEELWGGLEDVDTTQFASVFQGLIEKGIFDGVEGIEDMDMTDILTMLFTGSYKVEETPDVEFNPNVKLDEDGNVVDKTATEIKEELESSGPVETETSVEVDAEDVTVKTGDSSGVEEEVNKELKKQKMSVDVAADVKLTVSVSDSNGTEVGNQAGIELGNALADGIRAAGTNINTAASTVAGSAASAGNFNTAYTKMYGAGKYVMAGLKAGLASKADEIYALCKQVADKIAEVTSAALEVNSPSKVFMRIGRSTGEGFELGVRDSMQNAVKAAQDVVSNMNLNTRVLPDFEGAISGAVTSVYAAENSRPIYLNVNGKSLARVISKDTQQATNNANRRVGLGVGK